MITFQEYVIENLRDWFKSHKDPKTGKKFKGWINCKTGGPCGRKDTSKGSYPACRPTRAQCKNIKGRMYKKKSAKRVSWKKNKKRSGILNEKQFLNNHVAIAILGAPASGKSFAKDRIKSLASNDLVKLNQALDTGLDLTVDKLRHQFQSKDAKEQLIGFYKAYNSMRQLSQESPKEYSKWLNDIKKTWIKIDNETDEITTSIDQQGNLIFNNAVKETDIINNINQLPSDVVYNVIKTLDQYNDYKRVVRWSQNAAQETAHYQQKDIVYDEAGDEPAKIIQRFTKLRKGNSPYITCAFLLHGDTPATNLIQNAGRMVSGTDGGRDSSGAIIQAWTDIQRGLQSYYNTSEKIVTANNTEDEIRNIFNFLKQTNTTDNDINKSIDLLAILKTQSPQDAYNRTVNKLKSDPQALKFLNAILVYMAYYLPGLDSNTKQLLLNLVGDQVNKGNLKQVFSEIVNSNKFNFKLNNLEKMNSAVQGLSIQEKNNNPLLASHQKTFKDFYSNIFLEKSEDITVFCDMDGVLADFNSGTLQYVSDFKNEWDKLPVDFFLHLKKLPGADKLMSFLRYKFKNVYILSAAPKKHRGEISSRAVIDKKKWLETNFNFNPNNIIIGTREGKQKYAENNKNNILIDDLQENIDEWEAKGGTGILYTNTYTTIERLNAM